MSNNIICVSKDNKIDTIMKKLDKTFNKFMLFL